MTAFLHALVALRYPLAFIAAFVVGAVYVIATSERRIRDAFHGADVPYDDAERWQAAHGESDFYPRDELTAEENGEDERRRAGR